VPSPQQYPAVQSHAGVVQPPPAASVSPVPCEADTVLSHAVSAVQLSAVVERASPGLRVTTKYTNEMNIM